MTAGWGAKLEGHPFDLLDWMAALPQPYDPWVERREREDGEIFVLRSQSFAGLAGAGDVRERAVPLIERLNGALALVQAGEPVRFGGVAEISEQGDVAMHYFAELAGVRGRSRASAVGVALGPDGSPIPTPMPTRSPAQRWAAAAELDDELADLFAFLARPDSWYDLYKAIELAQRIAGSQHALLKLIDTDATEFKRVKRTANFYRHARESRPATLSTLEEARATLARAVRRLLDSFLPAA